MWAVNAVGSPRSRLCSASKCTSAGMNALLKKPVHVDELVAVLERFVPVPRTA